MAVADFENMVERIENANFVMLSLYREYSKILLKEQDKEYCKKQMRLINHDMLYLDKPQLILKVQEIYVPLLKNMLKIQRGVK